MVTTTNMTAPIILFISLVIAFMGLLFWWVISQSNSKSTETTHEISISKVDSSKPESNSKQSQHVPSKSNKKKTTNNWRQNISQQFSHPHLLTNLKGHSGPITSGDFSSNGKHFISSSSDRSVLIWATKEFGNKEIRSTRGNINLDHATNICWSPDSKAFIVHKATANVIEVYKVAKRPDGSLGNIQPALEFSQHEATMDIIALDMAVTGKYIMTCDSKNQLLLWSLQGDILEQLDTRHGDTYSAAISPCGRFIATSGFTPDVKIWEVKFSKSGAYEGIKRAFELKGHKSGIYSCGFNQDSTKMVSVSKDGTWRLYDTNIEFHKGQEPYLILSGTYESKDRSAIIRLSPDGRTIALASNSDMTFYSAITGETMYTIQHIFSDAIIDVKFDPSSKYVLTLGDKYTRVFHNVAGYKTTIQDLEKSKTNASTVAMRERIAIQIKEAELALKTIEEKVAH